MVAKIDVNKVELVWPGKYNDDGSLKEVPRVHLPFQVIETVNESRASRETAKKPGTMSLFDVYEGKEGDTFEEGWKNKLIWGDNLLVMGSLLEKFAGKIDLIYIDPPFATGADFSFTTDVGEDIGQVYKEQSALEEKAYRDTWGRGTPAYLDMLLPRLYLMRELLSERGTLYLHIDYRHVHRAFSLLEEVFGAEAHRNDIVWSYGGRGAKAISGQFPRNHDMLLVFSKGAPTYNRVYSDIEYSIDALPSHIRLEEDGTPFKTSPRGDYTDDSVARLEAENRIYRTRSGGIRVKYPLERRGSRVIEKQLVGDVWSDIPDMMHSPQAERLDYPTQKPERLLSRVIEAASNPRDLVADFFCGSGTAVAVAEKLDRRWIGCDLGRWALHVARKRLLGIEDCQPFEVLNLGKYERRYWAGVTFGDKRSDEQLTVFEYLAFILKLYDAQPLSGTQHLHGKKGRAMVHVGAVDAPVTIDEVNACIDECQQVKQHELHVLGWEWEMGMSPYIVQEAKRRGIKLLLLTIPREVMEQQAVDKGDVRFFELAHVEVSIKKLGEREIQIELTDFAFPYADLIPEDVREKITKWSDYVDYWAIDWDFRSDTFMQGWVAYRTRRDRSLPLVADPHTYEEHNTVNVMIKVVDIFGNDTSQVFPVEV